ncbi:MAG TPA: SDR family NAD(P)-dependent oxidoreductase, partial [Dehalococcoidia bacterium]|nr:SDR family NAD(P)-dependent oxidoreductase [Dehalococcoidia bacterium]
MDASGQPPVALITGGTGGLGGAVTRAFLDHGCTAVVTWVIEAEAEQMRQDFPEVNGRLLLERVDVSDGVAVGKLVAGLRERFGRIDHLLNLVGGWAGGPPVYETSDDDFERMLTLNLRTAFVCSRAVLPLMIEHNFGR